MNARERVMKAWKLMDGTPDRVPVQFDLCDSLLKHFSKELGIPLSITKNIYEDVTWRISGNEIRLALGADVVDHRSLRGSGFSSSRRRRRNMA